VYADLVLISSIFMHECRTIHRVLFLARWERSWAGDFRAVPLYRFHNLLRRLIDQLVVVCLQLDSNTRWYNLCFYFNLWSVSRHYSIIFVTTPAPTVRPPSRIENRIPSSMATFAPSSTVMLIVSPGITISVPSGRNTSPVTSVVRT